MDQDKVCNGFSDCPGGEDEKKCAALIEDDTFLNYDESLLNKNKQSSEITIPDDYSLPGEQSSETEPSTNRETIFDQEAVESSILESTTLHAFKSNVQSEKIVMDRNESAKEERVISNKAFNGKTLVSGREISSNSKGTLPHRNSIHVSTKKNDSNIVNFKKEINNYNEKGYISIRKNGKWGKLCLSGMDDLLQERQATWTVEDLGRAVCKAITYQYVISKRCIVCLHYGTFISRTADSIIEISFNVEPFSLSYEFITVYCF